MTAQRGWLLSALLLWASGRAEDAPDYSQRTNLYNQTVLTPIPHARFLNAEAFKQHQACKAQGKKDSECGRYAFTAPYSLDTATVRVGTALRTAWQRLEDRYYWRAVVRLNNPVMNVTHCLVNWSTGSAVAKAPALTLNTEANMVPAPLAGKLPLKPPDDQLKLDRYGLMPSVPNTDYCQNLDWDLSIMYLPGTCFWLGSARLFCIEGTTPSINPLAPAPLAFRFDLARQRILKAIKEANTEYLADYVKDVVKALSPSATFFPLLWSGLNNAVIAPTMSLKPDLTFLKAGAQEAGDRLGGIFKATAYPYYLQSLTGPNLALRAHLLPKTKDVLGQPNPPGVWKLEEFKRRFPVNNPVMYERFGYTNLFEAWNEIMPRLLPEEVAAKPLRQMIYLAEGNNIFFPSPVPVPMPAPMLIPEYSAGLPYTGPQTRFTWVSVGEGYEVPRVSGVPALDYSGVTK